jgi:ParB family chromosome partitioning protein
MNDEPGRKGPARGLGRGLSALMADLGPAGDEAPRPDLRLPVAALVPNPDQPRRSFPPEALAELAASVREKGVIQPLIVRPDPVEPGRYQIAAGERRWRAAQAAGLDDVPVIVRDYDDAELLEVAIIENVQRADLNAIDEGSAYRQLMERFGHTQEQVATALGKSRSHVANQMRLLQLPEDVQRMVVESRLSAGHVRPLIGHPDAAALARRIAARRLSAREAERLARRPAAPEPRPPKDEADLLLEHRAGRYLGVKVRIDRTTPGPLGGGRLTITFKDHIDLENIIMRLERG